MNNAQFSKKLTGALAVVAAQAGTRKLVKITVGSCSYTSHYGSETELAREVKRLEDRKGGKAVIAYL